MQLRINKYILKYELDTFFNFLKILKNRVFIFPLKNLQRIFVRVQDTTPIFRVQKNFLFVNFHILRKKFLCDKFD